MGCSHVYSASAALGSDTLCKSQTAGSAVDAAASDGTDADDVEVPAASASSTERWRNLGYAGYGKYTKQAKRGKTALFVATVVATANFRIQIQLLECHSRLIVKSITCKFHYLQIPPCSLYC